MTTALIGYTGYVGTTLRGQTTFDHQFNSSNIADIEGNRYSLVVCAGAPAAKWIANQDPEADLANLKGLMGHLEAIDAERFILISTVDVYQSPRGVDETTPIDTDGLHAYGTNRYALEEFVRSQFENHRVVRLPGLFGTGLRKNFLYDMVHRGHSEWTHAESSFQFYNMAHLWRDLQTVLDSDVNLINFATEPVKVADVARDAFGTDYTYETEKPPVHYDMQTIHADVFGESGRYMASAEATIEDIKAFAATEKSTS